MNLIGQALKFMPLWSTWNAYFLCLLFCCFFDSLAAKWLGSVRVQIDSDHYERCCTEGNKRISHTTQPQARLVHWMFKALRQAMPGLALVVKSCYLVLSNAIYYCSSWVSRMQAYPDSPSSLWGTELWYVSAFSPFLTRLFGVVEWCWILNSQKYFDMENGIHESF